MKANSIYSYVERWGETGAGDVVRGMDAIEN